MTTVFTNPDNSGQRAEISVVINTKNEEKSLERCLQSVLWADEIVIMDMNSSDRTLEIARKYTPHVYTCPEFGYVEPARNMAIDKATKEWVLVLDADETIPQNFADGIQTVIRQSAEYALIAIPRKNYMGDHLINDPVRGADHQHRLFRRGKIRWRDAIHSQPQVDGMIKELDAAEGYYIKHYNYRDFTDFIDRINKYTTVEAAQVLATGSAFDWHHIQRKMLDELRGRYEEPKDGVHTLLMAGAMAFYQFLTYGKALEKLSNENKDFKFDLPAPGDVLDSSFALQRQIAEQTQLLEDISHRLKAREAQYNALITSPSMRLRAALEKFFSNLTRPVETLYRFVIPYPGLVIARSTGGGPALNGVNKLTGTLKMPAGEPQPLLQLRIGAQRIDCNVEPVSKMDDDRGIREYYFACEFSTDGRKRLARLLLGRFPFYTKRTIASYLVPSGGIR